MVTGRPTHALYRGWVRHRRFTPRAHAFRYRLFLVYLDLATLDEAFRGRALWSIGRRNVCWFRRADYLGDPARPLDDEVRRAMSERLGRPVRGPVGVLTQLRMWGYVQNPVTFYYAYKADTGALDAVLAEVTNTPWGERYAYALDARVGSSARSGAHGHVAAAFPKAFHVSPFFGMAFEYRWRFTAPAARLVVHMENVAAEGRAFDATLLLRREPLDAAPLARALLRHPFMTGRIGLAIYWQALRLWWKGVPFVPHPGRRPAAGGVA